MVQRKVRRQITKHAKDYKDKSIWKGEDLYKINKSDTKGIKGNKTDD